MTLEGKLKYYKEHLDLSDEHMARLLGMSEKKLNRLLDGKDHLTDKQLSNICAVFGIKEKDFLDSKKTLTLVGYNEKIDLSKYRTIIQAYVDIIKKYFGDPWEVYVLAKIYNPTKFQKFLDIFKPYYKIADGMMSNFEPNYIAFKGEDMILISIENGILKVSELPPVAKNKRFTLGRFAYVRANKLKLTDDPVAVRYF